MIFVLLLIQISMILQHPWSGDYWEHRAVLQELIDHPINPQHPLLNTNMPHPFFSPYLVAAGYLGSLFNADAGTILDILSILNFCLFLLCIYLLRKILLQAHTTQKGMSILLFMLLLYWGINPPFYSSFIHLGSFPYTLSYPSAFAWITSVLAAYSLHLLNGSNNTYQKLYYTTAGVLLVSICLLTHPLTYFWSGALIGVVAIEAYHKNSAKKNRENLRSAILLLSLPWLLAACWPYYPFYSLLHYTNQPHQVHADSRELYSNIYLELLPLFLIIPLLLRNPFERIRKQLSLWIPLAGLSLIFICGFLTHAYIIGRSLAFIAILAQIILIREVDSLQDKRTKWIWSILLILLTIPFCINTIPDIINAATTTHRKYLEQPLNKIPARNPPAVVAHHLMFLQKTLPKNKVVLADTPYLPYLPGLGAKVPAVMTPVYWIPDNEEKKAMIRSFFHDAEANHAAILTRLNADYILLPSSDTGFLLQKWQALKKLSVVQKDGFSLYQIKH
jgi:hypothetical protein